MDLPKPPDPDQNPKMTILYKRGLQNEPFWLARTPAATRTSTARPWSAIPKTRRHPDEALVSNPKTRRHPRDTPTSNPHGTAPPRRRPDQQSLRHGATHATRPPALPMAQRRTRDTPSSNPHGTAPPTRHAQQQSP